MCKSTIVEDKVFIAMGCITSNTKKISYLRPYKNINTPCRICYGVRIGIGVKIMPDVIIGENCSIGVGSIVTKSTKPKGVYIGNPAKYVKDVGEDEII
jgi:acetyltransferase-like isoleucine patch superfamily enzyme